MPLSSAARYLYNLGGKFKSAVKKYANRAEPFRQEADREMDKRHPDGWQREKTNSLMQMEHSEIMEKLYKKSKRK